jgi:hypothetical protein
MKRSMDLIREILLHIEENQNDVNPLNVRIKGYSDYEITYHLNILKEANLVTLSINFVPDSTGINICVSRMTWGGHEFLEAAKDKKRWESAKKYLLGKVGSTPFTILQSLLLKIISEDLKL